MTSVLDENVVYTAIDGWNPRRESDSTPWALFSRIQETCDWTVLTSEILDDYYEIAWSRNRVGRWTTTCQSWVDLLNRWRQMDKIRLASLDEMPELTPESGVKDDDEPVVRLAKGTGAILVSYDEKLEPGAARNGVTLVPPAEAIPLVKRPPRFPPNTPEEPV